MPESTLLHYDCYSIFKEVCTIKESDLLNRLWMVAMAKQPWQGARPILLSKQKDIRKSAAFRRIAQAVGMPWLSQLPLELLETIRGHSRYSLFWRCVSALQLAEDISGMEPKGLQTCALTDILSWERGGQLEVQESPELLPPVVRITLDSDGIHKVERLPSIPQYTGELNNRFAFIIERAAKLSGVGTNVQDGYMRLAPLPGDAPVRYNVVPMNKIKGITFFFNGPTLQDMFIHHSEESSAWRKYQRLSAQLRKRCAWIYVPNLDKDPLTYLAIRRYAPDRINILIRTEKAGDVALGHFFRSRLEDRPLAKSTVTALIYNEPVELSFTSILGAKSEPPNPALGEQRPFRSGIFKTLPKSLVSYFSWAPLGNVSSVLVFYDEKGFCRGIMLHYKSGGCRALGQCRIHVDTAEEITEPATVCFYNDDSGKLGRRGITKAKVRFGQDYSHEECVSRTENGEPWQCFPLEGVMKFWFASDASWIAIEEEDEGVETAEIPTEEPLVKRPSPAFIAALFGNTRR
ncbi:hypothetical protein PT974_02093 [Cladobotryum mycophilum]|uniref:Uncharacterized protein n=1 Tax=Cladobotryum mycophilum TaxID=491253 RepID=A0ABR0SXZ9_9HYPO